MTREKWVKWKLIFWKMSISYELRWLTRRASADWFPVIFHFIWNNIGVFVAFGASENVGERWKTHFYLNVRVLSLSDARVCRDCTSLFSVVAFHSVGIGEASRRSRPSVFVQFTRDRHYGRVRARILATLSPARAILHTRQNFQTNSSI